MAIPFLALVLSDYFCISQVSTCYHLSDAAYHKCVGMATALSACKCSDVTGETYAHGGSVWTARTTTDGTLKHQRTHTAFGSMVGAGTKGEATQAPISGSYRSVCSPKGCAHAWGGAHGWRRARRRYSQARWSAPRAGVRTGRQAGRREAGPCGVLAAASSERALLCMARMSTRCATSADQERAEILEKKEANIFTQGGADDQDC